jgi:hypothetical protein
VLDDLRDRVQHHPRHGRHRAVCHAKATTTSTATATTNRKDLIAVPARHPHRNHASENRSWVDPG